MTVAHSTLTARHTAMTDGELLRQYVATADQQAFSAVIAHHTDWIYSAALRQVSDPGLAADVAQGTFILLSNKARQVAELDERALVVWLFKALRFEASVAMRSERRRKRREQKVAMSQKEAVDASENDQAAWRSLAPLLEGAVDSLRSVEKSAILLRFYRGQSYAQVAAAIGTSEEAARKRVDRAVEKLRSIFATKGMAVTLPVLATLLTEKTVAAAPISLLTATGATSNAYLLAQTGANAMSFASIKLITLTISFAAALLVATGLIAQQLQLSSPTLVPATATTASLAESPQSLPYRGKIVDQDGKPVVGATVTMLIEHDYDVTAGPAILTAADGAFAFPEIQNPQDPEKIRFRRDLVLIETNEPSLFAAQLRKDFANVVRMPPTTEARFTVVDAQGTPAPGIRVQIRFLRSNESLEVGSDGLSFAMTYLPSDQRAKWSALTNTAGVAIFKGMPQFGGLTMDVDDDRYVLSESSNRLHLEERAVTVGKPLQLLQSASISGRAVIAETGAPAAHASISAQGTGSSHGYGAAITDSDGRFSIKRLEVGLYRVQFNADRAGPPPDVTAAPIQNVQVKAGADTPVADIRLINGGLISGRVADKQSGRGIPEISVGAYAPYSLADQQYQTQLFYTTTDADGRYTLRVPPGMCHLYLQQQVTGYDQPPAVDLEVTDSKTVAHEFLLNKSRNKNKSPTTVLNGLVINPDGTPAAFVMVRASLADGSNARQLSFGDAVPTDETGNFRFNGLSLPAKLSVHTPGGIGTKNPVVVEKGTKDVKVQLEEQATYALVAHVIDKETGKPVANADMMPMINMDGGSSCGSERAADEHGEFRWTGIWHDSSYSLQVSAPGYSIGAAKVEPPTAGNEQMVEIKLTPATESIDGIVLDEAGKPAAGVNVGLSGRRTRQQNAVTDEHGTFEFKDLVSGDSLTVFARHNDDGRNMPVQANFVAGIDKSVEIHFKPRQAPLVR